MKKVSRREAITKLAAGGAGVALVNVTGLDYLSADERTKGLQNQTSIVGQAPARAFRGVHQPKPLTFDPAKLTGISEKLIRSHWENNYGGAIKALNAVEQRLDAMLNEKDLPPYIYGDLKREELVRTGSVVLHDYYFGNLGGDGRAGGKALDLLKQWFGSYEQWEAEFIKTASALGGGSGWVTLAFNFHTREIHNYWSWDHMHNAPTGFPLLVLDMYEHAYHMDYGAAAARYIDAFLKNVNWEEVNRRLEVVMKFGPG